MSDTPFSFIPVTVNGWIELENIKAPFDTEHTTYQKRPNLKGIGISPFFNMVTGYRPDETIQEIRKTASAKLGRVLAKNVNGSAARMRRLYEARNIRDQADSDELKHVIENDLATEIIASFASSEGQIGFHIDFTQAQDITAMIMQGRVVTLMTDAEHRQTTVASRWPGNATKRKKPATPLGNLRPL